MLFLFVGGVVGIAAFEGRVLFHAFSQYILLRPPWSWIIVSAFLYLKAAIVAAHFAGRVFFILSFYLRVYGKRPVLRAIVHGVYNSVQTCAIDLYILYVL